MRKMILLCSIILLGLKGYAQKAEHKPKINPEKKQQILAEDLQTMLGESAFQSIKNTLSLNKVNYSSTNNNYLNRILDNDEEGLFEEIEHPFETFYFQSSAVGDYDGDGYLDVLLCGGIDATNAGGPNTTFCQLYKNNYGVFEPVDDFSINSLHLGDVKFVDFNNNGLLDIVITGQSYDNILSYYTYLYKNTGTNFELLATYSGYIFSEINIGDINSNGNQDIILNGRTSESWVPRATLYENLGDYNFEEQELPITPSQMTGNMKVMDVNNNNLLDIVVMGSDENYDPLFNVFVNTGDGFELHQSLEGISAGSINYADFNGNGYLDLVVNGTIETIDDYLSVLRVYWNDGEGNFTPQDFENPISNSNGNQSIEVGDLNNDGYYDFIVYGDGPNYDGQVRIYIYNPQIEDFYLYEEATGLSDIGGTANVQLLDFNKDNHLDILVSGYADVNNSYEAVTKLYKNKTTEVNNAPTPPSVLEVYEDDEYLVFTWEGAEDDKTPYAVLRYELIIGGESSEEDIAKYVVTTPSWKLKKESIPSSFYWSVKSIDASKVYSEKSKEMVFQSLSTPDFETVDWQLYPNPATSILYINGIKLDRYTIYGVDGRKISEDVLKNENKHTLSIEMLDTGIYILEIVDKEGVRFQKKFIKQ